jgi:hypothetical protein
MPSTAATCCRALHCPFANRSRSPSGRSHAMPEPNEDNNPRHKAHGSQPPTRSRNPTTPSCMRFRWYSARSVPKCASLKRMSARTFAKSSRLSFIPVGLRSQQLGRSVARLVENASPARAFGARCQRRRAQLGTATSVPPWSLGQSINLLLLQDPEPWVDDDQLVAVFFPPGQEGIERRHELPGRRRLRGAARPRGIREQHE